MGQTRRLSGFLVQTLSLTAMNHFDPETCSFWRGKQGTYQPPGGKYTATMSSLTLVLGGLAGQLLPSQLRGCQSLAGGPGGMCRAFYLTSASRCVCGGVIPIKEARIALADSRISGKERAALLPGRTLTASREDSSKVCLLAGMGGKTSRWGLLP